MNGNYGGQGKADVFLSYSHDDRAVVEQIAPMLQAAGFSCWIDGERLRAQERFNVAIDEAIDGSIVFLAFLSKTYVEKPYCAHEFDRAIDKKKSIMAVCIDDVSEETNRQSAYMFSFSAGHNILGFGTGVKGERELRALGDEIVNSIPMAQLKRYSESGEACDYPPVSTPDYLFAQLRLYHERQYRQSGNYALNEIRGELFPAIKDADLNIVYKDEERNTVSLLKYFSQQDSDAARKHVLVVGEGGMGKTVSLLRTCDHLLSQRINAVYVPLSKIDGDMTLDRYLERIVCGGNQFVWSALQGLMSAPGAGAANLVLLLDGINEVPLEHVETLIKKTIKGSYIDSSRGVQLIMTTRWLDNTLMHRLRDDVALLEMQPLDDQAIAAYLDSIGLPQVADTKLRSVIRTPLLLTLYADVEKHREKYQEIQGIHLEDNPNTAGKILGNFFQTQLFRAAEEENFDRTAHLVLLEFLLPAIAYRMLEKQSLFLSEDDAWVCVDCVDDGTQRYQWYRNDKLRKLVRGRSRIDTDALLDLAENALHFLHRSDVGYEFLHQSFRDYFAAYHIANEIWALEREPARRDDVEPLLEADIFPDEILKLVSDIVREDNARPELTADGWVFPGKDGRGPSRESVAEPLLSIWRDQEGPGAQNAVANLCFIMEQGRDSSLAWCDFSRLDMRKCWLNKCRFVEWYQDRYYTSTFDGAWIDRDNFLTDGHEVTISAVMSDGERYIFSGDHNGTVKVYDLMAGEWHDTLQPQTSAVVDLAWDEREGRLAILYGHVLFCYSPEEKKLAFSMGNESRSKDFRYVRFERDGALNVSYDLEPLVWYRQDGQAVPSELDYDVPARCARWNPKKKEFIRSNMLQLLSVSSFDETDQTWRLHPALQAMLEEENIQRTADGEKLRAVKFLSLRDVGAQGSGSINCISYHQDGGKVLVAIQNLLVEYDTESFAVLHKKTFQSDVQSACYRKGGLVASFGRSMMLLDEDFSEEAVLRGSQINPIGVVAGTLEGDGYMLFSYNGEVKKLDQQLVVRNMRKITRGPQFVWVRDRLTQTVQMAFLPRKTGLNGARYTYECDRMEPLGWRYEFLDHPLYDDDEQRIYKMNTQLMVIDCKPPFRKIIYNNYTGIWIFGCSFLGIRGTMKEDRNQAFLVQNGGITDGNAE